MATDLEDVLNEFQPTTPFKPYSIYSKEADCLTIYISPDAEYAQRLTDHVTVFLSMDTDELVGCRIKGVREIIDDLPNYIAINHGDIQLSAIFLPFRSQVTNECERQTLNKLAKATSKLRLEKV